MDAKLNGLNLSQPRQLTAPDQLVKKSQQAETPSQDNTPTQNNDSSLAQSDSFKNKSNINMTSAISAGLGGGIAAATTAKDMGIIGESMRSLNVQNSMSELQDRMNNGGSSGYNSNSSYDNNSYNNNSYNNNGYSNNNDYGATEFVRRRGYGRVEFTPNSRYGRVESLGVNSPEANLAMKSLAGGALQGAKFGGIIGGITSSVVNAYKVLTGKEKGSEGVGSVVADTVTASLSGAGGAILGGGTALGLGLIGIGGLPGIILATGIGAAGAVGSQVLMQKSGLYDSIKDKVKGYLSK